MPPNPKCYAMTMSWQGQKKDLGWMSAQKKQWMLKLSSRKKNRGYLK